ncbi:MAG: transcription-repair coupling factor [Planctomycetes bacterium]|nr:transcription-repair coupling factor [Planctomycetota bacterium]
MIVIPSIAEGVEIKRLCNSLARSAGVVHASGLWGSSAPMVTACAANAMRRPFLYVTAHFEESDEARDDSELFLGRDCNLFPAWESLPGEGAASGEIDAERLKICTLLQRRIQADGGDAPFIVAPVQALMQPVPTPAELSKHTLHLNAAGSSAAARGVTLDELVAWAVDHGYERLDMVETPGDFARRGDIVDLFVPGDTDPTRIQFFGDTVESIRRFDVGTQRSRETIRSLAVSALPQGESAKLMQVTDFFAYLPDDTVVVLDGPSDIQETGMIVRSRSSDPKRLLPVTDVLSAATRFTQLHLSRFGTAGVSTEDSIHFDVASVSKFETDAGKAVAELCRVAQEGAAHVVCDNEGERNRLREMITDAAPGALSTIEMHIGVMHRGFEWRSNRTVVVGHHEIFNRNRPRRRIRKLYASRPIDSWLDLKPGDFVVHVVHGIGRFRELKRMRKGESGQQEEFLTLEFAEGARVHVPASQIDLVQKYIGAGGIKPTLSTIGGKRWGKTKEQVAGAVSDLAEQLLRTQAARSAAVGIAYPNDTEWQREFEAAFPYEETEDQLLVTGEIRDDLTRARPMDRLLCGDVGYGKTELAMRAAFKVVEYGRQVAMLVPTTVLAEQHYDTFRDRMAEYPISVGCLSRFRKPAEQKKLIDQIRKGRIDIVIGTHRLLSKDVSFAALGLVIIDEEQRFGVEHKERLKTMRDTVDMLTMTATPIPRTLHMAMMGLRDISSLQTPPVDRRSIATHVGPFNKHLIRDAILREMNRDGQVYFIHNFVQSIEAIADHLRAIVPEARFLVGHGQMKSGALEGVMHRFVRRKADVLVATTIVESGIDIPNVNTIFINRADRFGLADLHQLRGRVGRSHQRAYCYLLLAVDRPPAEKAAKRLKAVEEFSELGAGFRIAMRDLEIRGAGSLLGKAQSGHIASVGYEMYCRMLERAVGRLKNEPDPTPPAVQIHLEVASHIPAGYIEAGQSRMEIYRRLAACATPEAINQLELDLIDAFGPIPKQVATLLQLAELRVHARRFTIRSIALRRPDIVFSVHKQATAEPAFRDAPGSVRMPDPNTIHLRPPPNYLEPMTIVAVLNRMLAKAANREKSETTV